MEKELMYWSNKAYGKQPAYKISGVLMKECGNVFHELLRIEDYPDEKDVRQITLKTAIGDVKAMTKLLCQMVDVDEFEVGMEGEQRAIQRCKEKLQGKGGF